MSDNKVDNKLDFRNMKMSQFGGSQIERAEFSELKSAKRVFDVTPVLKDAYTHFIQTTNTLGYPTYVEYWQATAPAVDKLQMSPDVAGNKAGTYFSLQEYLTKKTHVLYYVVSGSGVAPGVGDIETPINITINDSAALVARKTASVIDSLGEFDATQPKILSSFLQIEYFQFGDTDAIDTGTSGFITSRLNGGSASQVGEIHLDYDSSGYPIYGGNTLKGLLYNPYTASFDVERDKVVVELESTPESFSVMEIPYVTAGSEVELTLPEGTKRYQLQVREPNTKMMISHISGGPTYTIRYGCSENVSQIKTVGVNLFIKLSRNNRTIEVKIWT